MQYSPKLKKAMEEIKLVLAKYDIAGFVVIHTPGNSEYFIKIDPTYSCAKFEGDMVRIKAKLSEYGGNKELWTEKVSDTANMFSLISETAGKTIIGLIEVSEKLDQIVDAEHFDNGHSSHTQQNN